MDGARCLGLGQTIRDSVFCVLVAIAFTARARRKEKTEGGQRISGIELVTLPGNDDGNDAWLAGPRWINIVIVIVESSIIIIIVAINAKGAEKPTLAPSGKCDLLCDHLPKNVCNVLEEEGEEQTEQTLESSNINFFYQCVFSPTTIGK